MNIDLERQHAAEKLTHSMRTQQPFSYLRLGDGELRWLIDIQEKKDLSHHQKPYLVNSGASVNTGFGARGLKLEHYQRLINAFEQCSYIDLYETVPYNQKNLSSIKLNFSSKTYIEPTETSKLIFQWTYLEFGKYISDRKCLFVCAEAPLLKELYQDRRYRQIASDYWPSDAQAFFLKIRDDGRYYWDYLDEIKNNIKTNIIEHKIDSVFISLGTGAKILCYELAEELKICAFDFGSVTRGLAYAGSPGYHSARSTHTPFFFRVPFNIYMEALEKAYPKMTIVDLLSKAHAQLCLELQKKVLADSTAVDAYDGSSFDPSSENLENFWKSYRDYRKKYFFLARKNTKARKLINDFTRYRRFNGIGFDGKILMLFISLKEIVKKIISKTK